MDTDKDYWLQKLAGDLVVTGLPLDHHRSRSAVSNKERLSFAIDAQTEAHLRKLTGNDESLLFVTFIMALNVCLFKYTGNEDIIVGATAYDSASMNRLLALRTRVTADLTVKQLLLDIKDTLAEAYAHQKFPFERLVELLNVEDLSHRMPLFDVMVVLGATDDTDYFKNDVTLILKVNDNAISGALDYNPDLFTRESLEVLARHLQEILRAASESPDQTISQLELLSPSRRKELVVEYNNTASEYPRDKTIVQLFVEQVEKTPAHIALEFQNESVTYRELDQRANQLANWLRARGITAGVPVGIYLEHSAETIVALFGVLKAGGFYVPFDIAHPRARLDFMLADTATPLVLTQERLREKLAGSDVEIISIDANWPAIALENATPPKTETTPDDLAYVIYTSGSTGEPKGVEIRHRNLVNYIWWAKDQYVGDETVAFALYSSLAFDLTVTSIYTPLITGNRSVIYREDGGGNSAIEEILKDNKAGVLKLTPSHLALVKIRDNSRSRIRRLIVGGEQFETELATAVLRSFDGNVEIINEYGPTEATVGCMIHRFDPAQDTQAVVPVGKPAANGQIYVLDDDLKPVAENVLGEMYLAGDGLARGYLKRATLTAEKFIDNPFTPGQRMYRTGDLARWLPNGIIEYVGRKDGQVKYHGYRIELNEIKRALNRYPQVRDSVIVIARDKAGNDAMVAYYVSRHELDSAELYTFLTDSIIEETIPNVFVHLKKLPLTLNGKLNLRALPTLDEVKQRAQHTYVAPRNQIEEQLAEIWQQVFGVERVGIHDNFFELGGHSLIATQVIGRVRQMLHTELAVRAVFETPTIAALGAEIEKQRATGAAEVLPIPRVRRDLDVPLSFAQQRLWVVDQLDPGSAAYNIPLAIRISGPLNCMALERSFNELLARHESLRTTFQSRNGQPVQIIAPPEPFHLPLVELGDLAEHEREAETQRRTASEAERPFDLSQGPLLRIQLLRLAADSHVLLLVMHHIVSDGWSMDVLVQELTQLYDAFNNDQPSPLPELPIQYADFAVWQRQWLAENVLEGQLAYWKQQLGGDLAVLDLPTDWPRPAVQTYRGANYSFKLSSETTAALKQVGEESGATLFMTLLAAFKALLARLSGQEDILIGVPIAGRNRAELETLIGFFVNTLVLRTDLGGNPTFVALLERVRDVSLTAYQYQDVPLEKLMDELRPERDVSRTPLFQAMFSVQKAGQGELAVEQLAFTSLPATTATAKFDLTLVLEESGEELRGTLNYNTDLFARGTIERMIGQYQRLLSAVVANPELHLWELPLLTEAQKQQQLVDWNDTQAEYPEQCIQELFEAQVAQSAQAVALVFGEEEISFGELNRRANQLAHYLRQQGIGPEVLVGISLDRSVDLVVGLLAIIKAGGAYVPLDPQYPLERLAFMIEDAGLTVLLTRELLSTALPPSAAAVVCVDRDAGVIAEQSCENPLLLSHPDDLAYVIYTSGSTGIPKGVSVPHRGVVRLVWNTNYVELNNTSRIAQASNASFDALTFELWGALLHGGQLVGVSHDLVLSPEDFGDEIARRGINTMFLTTALFNQMARNAPQAFRSVRYLLFGGEAVDPQWVRRVLEQGPPRQLLHVYGPTENTTFSTYQVVEQVAANAVTAPIGAPIANTTAYVLDQRLEPAPIGVAGELYLGGAGLAREYLRRPELTAENFVPHPYSAEGGARLYRTGDQVRWLADGTLEFLGRLDQQVKLRGFRVELGEIESVLNEHEAVQESVVLARVDEPGEKRLVAYVVAEAGAGLNASELRLFVRGRLPEYMAPSAFVLLDRLPLTKNGKVDRRSLPAPEESRLDLGEDYVAPETEVEKILAGVWAEVLRVERVGVCDNYFALGGDSIRSVQVLSLAKERGLSFSLRQLFQHQTIRELACTIGSEEVTSGQSRRTEPFSLVKDEDRQKLPADVVDAYPLSRLQLGMLYHLEATPDVLVYHDINTFHLKASLHEEFFVSAVRYVVERHDVLRTSFNLSSYSEPLQLVHREAELPVQFEDLRELSPADQQEVIKSYTESEQRNRFDLSRPALLRFCIHRRTDETFQFTFTACHAIVDGWSLQSTLAEIFQTYFALLSNTSIPEHKPFATSFRDFIALEQANLESEECRRFWRDSLSDATVTEIAPWPAESSATGRKRTRYLKVHMPDEVTEGLHRLAVNAAVPLKSVLFAAHLKVMSLVMGQSDVITGLACNGRPETTDGELIRGLFLNVVPFRLRVGAQSWTEFVRDTFNAERNLLPFRRYPLPAIQEQLNTPSFFETTCNYVHYHVLDGLLRQGDVQVLGDPIECYEETNFTLNAAFVSGVLSSRTTLRLAVDPLKVSDPQGEAIRGYYERVLAAMASDTLNPLETEPFLDDAERHKVLVEWNDTACDFPHDMCFHQLFERQVERTPDAEAVVFGEWTLSYRELNSRANHLAHHLRSLGVGPETLVGISVERSIEMVVGILGILKAGGAFVPLDPSYPQDRLAFMIEDSSIEVLLTQEWLVEHLPPFSGTIIYLEQLENGSDRSYTTHTDENLDINTTPQNAAYVIYTSGSTGTPKGVVIAHRGLCNLATAQIRAFNVQPSSRVLQYAALSFDASVSEFAMALLQGAALVIAPPEDLMPGERLISLLRDHAITTVTFPPSVLALLPPEEFPDLRTIIVAGEACWAELVERWAVDGRLFCNAYGPTENTVCISIAECAPDGCKPTIGRPLANVQVYVLDENMRLAPLGVPGEIYAGGEGLARAYLNRPDLTATRFVPNPYSTVPGARLYRTGDRGRYLPDGELEFLGRVDHQVKLRGFRVEPGEIEAVLCRHDAVRDAIVVARGERNGDKRLVAYVVGDAEASELRNYLHEQLPDYMVPSAWVTLDALPLTTNGKVDRKALPAPDSQRPELSSAYIAPRSAIERDIAAVWQEALGIENPGVNDNFFDLGGHSLQAVRVHARLRAKFEKNLLLFELFQFPTIAAMAKYISNGYTEESSAEQGVERGETRRELRSRRRQMRKAAGEN